MQNFCFGEFLGQSIFREAPRAFAPFYSKFGNETSAQGCFVHTERLDHVILVGLGVKQGDTPGVNGASSGKVTIIRQTLKNVPRARGRLKADMSMTIDPSPA